MTPCDFRQGDGHQTSIASFPGMFKQTKQKPSNKKQTKTASSRGRETKHKQNISIMAPRVSSTAKKKRKEKKRTKKQLRNSAFRLSGKRESE